MEATCSPDVERKIVAASTDQSSYAAASAQLKELAELEVSAKQCERITQRIGRERLTEREVELVAYEQLPLPQQQQTPADAPSNSWDGRVAAVLIDGGRAQIRDERWGQPHLAGEKVSWWREPKTACLATFSGRPQAADPLPEVPDCLLDPLWVIPRVREIKGGRNGDVSQDAGRACRTAGAAAEDAEQPPHWSPEPLVRSIVSTFEPYEYLGRLAKAAAYHRGFAAAPRKVFLGDGHLANWGIQEREFSDYTPVTDLMHALSYVYQAALESTPDMPACWDRCQRWITCVWQGQVGNVIEELTALVEAAPESSREKLKDSLTYLTNNRHRMRYNEYRQAGLPITTTIIESTIKQMSRRMKGTEKFWKPGAEPQNQLCADRKSETLPLDQFWRRRQARQTGFRKSRTTA